MADDTESLRFLRSELERMTTERNNAFSEAKGYRVKLRAEKAARAELQTKLDDSIAQAGVKFKTFDEKIAALEAERDQWKGKAELAPDEAAKRLRELETQLKVRDLKDAFRPVADQLGEGLTLEHLWKLNDFDPSAVDPKDLKVDDVVKAWREATPSLFKGADAPTTPPGGAQQGARPPLRVGEAPGRGGRDTSPGTVKYRASELARPGWEVSNPALLAAIQSGNAEVVD